jgi:hypothetical protein
MKTRIDPYMQPLYDALDDFLPKKVELIEKVEIAPLAFMRVHVKPRVCGAGRSAEYDDANEDVPDPSGRGRA